LIDTDEILQTTSEAIELDTYVAHVEDGHVLEDDRSLDEVKDFEQAEDLYSIKNFAL
jgi:hypothetical protein